MILKQKNKKSAIATLPILGFLLFWVIGFSVIAAYIIQDQVGNSNAGYNFELGDVVNESSQYYFNQSNYDTSNLGTSPVSQLNDYTQDWRNFFGVGLISIVSHSWLFVHNVVPTGCNINIATGSFTSCSNYDTTYYINNSVHSEFNIYGNTHQLIGYTFDGEVINFKDWHITIYEIPGWGGLFGTTVYLNMPFVYGNDIKVRTITNSNNYTVFVNDVLIYNGINHHPNFLSSVNSIYAGLDAHLIGFNVITISANTWHKSDPASAVDIIGILLGIVVGFNYQDILPFGWNLLLIKLPALLCGVWVVLLGRG